MTDSRVARARRDFFLSDRSHGHASGVAMGGAPAFGCRADFNLRETQFEFAHRVGKIVRLDADPVASVPPVLKSKRRSGRSVWRQFHFQANAEGLVGGDGDLLVERSGPALIGIQRSREVTANTKRGLTSCACRPTIRRTAGEKEIDKSAGMRGGSPTRPSGIRQNDRCHRLTACFGLPGDGPSHP